MLVVVLWALAEATLFFVVADVPISAIGLRHGLHHAFPAALAAAFAAACGGMVTAYVTSLYPQAVVEALALVPGIGPHLMRDATAAYAEESVRAMLAGSFSGVPYKLYAYAAGVNHDPLLGFFLASIGARLPRFVLVASISSGFGAFLRPRLTCKKITVLFFVFWILFYALYFTAMHVKN